MSITYEEQETVIQYDRTGELMHIYTSDTTQMIRFDKIYKRSKEHRAEGEVVAVEYDVPKRLLTCRAKPRKVTMTAEQRAAASARMKKLRQKQLEAKA